MEIKVTSNLQEELAFIDESMATARSIRSAADRELCRLGHERERVLREMKAAAKASKDIPQISDHAMLRWFERHYKINVEEERKLILSKIIPFTRMSNSGKIPVAKGLRAILRDNVVVTISPS